MKFIIPMIVGSIIGYFTNWLAIKMLFRPHEERRIFGVRVPFTPGLIPKERYRISESIGKAVGEHLLTPEKITEVLSSKETRKNIKDWINININKLKENQNSLLDILDKLKIYNYHKTIGKLEEKIVDSVILKLKSKSFKKEIVDYLEYNVYEKYKYLAWENIHIKGKEFLNGISNSEELKLIIIEDIQERLEALKYDHRILREIISEETLDNIYKSINGNRGNIIRSLRNFLHDPDLEKRLKFSIEVLINKNISKFITMFLDSETIANKVFDIIDKYINSEDAEEMALFVIKNSLDKIINIELSRLTNNILKLISENKIEDVADLILNQLSMEDNQNKIIEVLVHNIQSKDKEIKEGLLNFVNQNLEQGLESSEFRQTLFKIMDISINNLFNRSISSLLKGVNEDIVNKTTNFIGEIIHRFGHDPLMEIINLFDISSIVEEQINSFDVEYTESLILDIAEKELKAITWLGALLGAIMGLISPLLQILV